MLLFIYFSFYHGWSSSANVIYFLSSKFISHFGNATQHCLFLLYFSRVETTYIINSFSRGFKQRCSSDLIWSSNAYWLILLRPRGVAVSPPCKSGCQINGCSWNPYVCVPCNDQCAVRLPRNIHCYWRLSMTSDVHCKTMDACWLIPCDLCDSQRQCFSSPVNASRRCCAYSKSGVSEQSTHWNIEALHWQQQVWTFRCSVFPLQIVLDVWQQ